MADIARDGHEPIDIDECYADCQGQDDCLAYTFHYTEVQYSPRCDLYSLSVQNALAIDENYDTLQVWYDRACPPPAQFPPPAPLPPNKKIGGDESGSGVSGLWNQFLSWVQGGEGV